MERVGGTISSDGSSTRLTVRWNGNTLVIERGTYSGQAQKPAKNTERTEAWSLDPMGMLVITVTERSSGVEPTTTRLVYRKQ